MAKNTISKADIKTFLTRQVRDDVAQLRRELAVERLNINKAVGVGNIEDYAKEWEVDFINSSVGLKPLQPKNRSLKRTTKTKKRKVL